MPLLAGFIVARTTMRLVPVFLVCYGLAMLYMSEQINRKTAREEKGAGHVFSG
jgi:uncharacterized membrane protein